MPIDAFSNPDLLNVVGPVSIIKDPSSGIAGSLTVAGIVNANGGLAITGSLTGASLTAVSALTVNSGVTVTGGAVIDVVKGGTAAASAVQTITTTGGTITVGTKVVKVAQTTGGVITSATLNAGTAGQECIVINENVAGASTLIINTGIIFASGTTSVTISGLAGKRFIFHENQTLSVNKS